MLIGAHQSIAGGLYRALLRGREAGCAAIQIFVRSNMAWAPGKLTPKDAELFARTQRETGIAPVVAHGCYLVNLASTDARIRELSLQTTADELRRSEILRLPFLVIHPGAHLGHGETSALLRVARCLDRALTASESRSVRVLLETTAGQGTALGWRFEQLAQVIAKSRFPERIGVCYDTCHTFAAGYDIRTLSAYEKTMREFERILRLDKLLCFHFNDALKDLGSRRDRHTHIGRGKIGEAAFSYILRDKRFTSIPKILETPKGSYRRRSWDKINLDTLRRLSGEGQESA